MDWIKRFTLFHNKRHPKDMGADEIQAYITYLADERQVAASTQNQALSAIIFLYKHVLQKEVILPAEFLRPGRPERLPTVLSHQEAMAVIQKMSATPKLITQLLYGSGLRVSECLRLRIKDLDFDNHIREFLSVQTALHPMENAGKSPRAFPGRISLVTDCRYSSIRARIEILAKPAKISIPFVDGPSPFQVSDRFHEYQ